MLLNNNNNQIQVKEQSYRRMPKDKITVQKTAKEIKDATIKAGNYVATKTKQVDPKLCLIKYS